MACINGVCGITKPKPNYTGPGTITMDQFNKNNKGGKMPIEGSRLNALPNYIPKPGQPPNYKLKPGEKPPTIIRDTATDPNRKGDQNSIWEKIVNDPKSLKFDPTTGKALPAGSKMDDFLKGLKDFTLGKEGKSEQIPKFTPEQTKAREELLKQGLQGLQNPQGQFNPQGGIQQLLQQLLGQQQNPQTQQLLKQTLQGSQTPQGYGFQPIEDRARQQFQQNTVPLLAERFTANLQGNSKQGSSGFTGALGQAGADLESQLAVLRGQYGQQERQQLGQEQGQRQNLLGSLFNQGRGQQGLQQNLLGQLLGTYGQQQGLNQNALLNILQQGLQSPFESIYNPPTTGALGGLAQGVGTGLGLLGKAYLGG